MIFALLLCIFTIASVTAVKLTAVKMYYKLTEKNCRRVKTCDNASESDNTL
ncbi:hypothetical protein Osc1_14030 [Hominimerdicola sp. 21CYCFAH17_S]